jgi:hypothetical protein
LEDIVNLFLEIGKRENFTYKISILSVVYLFYFLKAISNLNLIFFKTITHYQSPITHYQLTKVSIPNVENPAELHSIKLYCMGQFLRLFSDKFWLLGVVFP